MVLSPYGDLLLHAGKGGPFDSTSAGSIFAAIQTATGGLNQVLKTKATTVKFGDEASGFWLEPVGSDWLIVGVKVAYKSALIAPLVKHLKSASKTTKRVSAPEALEGMSEASVDAALAKEME